MIKKFPVITVDGPSGVGKSALSYKISKKLKWNFLESGYMYRIIAYYIVKYKISLNEKDIISLFPYVVFKFKCINDHINVFFKKKNISNIIQSEKISMIASKIAVFPYVRNWLIHKQKQFRKFPGLVTNGRDMGTKIFPDAIVKIFLETSVLERAKRRELDLKSRGFIVSRKKIIKNIQKRDHRDRNRIISPLFPAKDSIIINSTFMNLKKTFKKSMKIIYKKLSYIK